VLVQLNPQSFGIFRGTGALCRPETVRRGAPATGTSPCLDNRGVTDAARELLVSLVGSEISTVSGRPNRVLAIDGDEVVDLVLEYYDRLGEEYKRRLPMRQVYVADRSEEV
jgi:hypothetical protein